MRYCLQVICEQITRKGCIDGNQFKAYGNSTCDYVILKYIDARFKRSKSNIIYSKNG